MLWYQAPGTWTDNTWIEGGKFSNFTLQGNNYVGEGIRVNRVVDCMTFENLKIANVGQGILGTKWGWSTSFINVYCYQCSISSINLTNAYNGCTFVNCALYGGNIITQIHLKLQTNSFGCSFVGGYIEGCTVGASISYSSIAFTGVDFEVCGQNFIQITGSYSGSTLNFANPPIDISGCCFVGVPSQYGIIVTGGQAEIHSNFFINQGSNPGAGIYAINGSATGDAGLCVSEHDNNFRGWNGQNTTGNVWSQFTALRTSAPSGVPQLYGAGLPTFNADTVIAKYNGLGDYSTYNNIGETGYVANDYAYPTTSLIHYANYQGGSPAKTYGKLAVAANITQQGSILATYGGIADTITTSFRPLSDNSTTLGSSSYRWSTVYAATGTINTSDANQKQQIQALTVAEQNVAKAIKGLIKTFKFNSAVVKKGDNARIHIGVIAQEVQSEFIAQGLDPNKYALFCSDTWYIDTENNIYQKNIDENNQLIPNLTQVTQLGIRYEELLAFVISAL
jgi:hypothetical protein